MEIFCNRNGLLFFFLIHFTASTRNISVQLQNSNANVGISTKDFISDYDLADRFQLFAPLTSNAIYTITICADVPDNNNIESVHLGQRPGHVFLILEKVDSSALDHSVVQVFGFYPVRQRSSLIGGNVLSKLVDNSGREYNASLSRKVSVSQFSLLLEKSKQLALRKYNLRRFNCYDYVLAVFNSIPGTEKLPVTHVKLPYFMGTAGSPCGLYRDLKKLKENQPGRFPSIQLGNFIAPESCEFK